MWMQNKYRRFLLLGIVTWALLGGRVLLAQELNCTVTIDASQLNTAQIAERQIFVDMKNAITQFMNTRKWTNDQFTPAERINCNIVFTLLQSPGIGVFVGTAQIQSSRPVYGTGYESVVLSFVDRELQFNYVQSQPMDFNENTFTSNLTSMLSFYAYVILGLDYDSFSKLGGTPLLQRAFNIATTAQEAQERGWKPFEDTRNRYWLIENLMSQQMLPFREGLYTYHRLVLDDFNKDLDKSRAQLLDVLTQIKQVNQLKPGAVLVNTFFDTKADELISIFSEASPMDKQKAYNLLVEMDPTKTDKYRRITQ
jgi:hypothetical protein